MRFLLLALPLLFLAACSGGGDGASPDADSTASAATDGGAAPAAADFDARAWRERASIVDTTGGYQGVHARDSVLADELDAATGWRAACAHPTEGASYPPDETTGFLRLLPFSDDEALVEVTCRNFGYQPAFALVRLDGAAAALVAAPQPDETGTTRLNAPVYVGMLEADPAAHTFAVFSKGRGAGDCGSFTTYRLDGDTGVVQEHRARGCTEPIPDDLAPPNEWPIVPVR
ncbi:MAG TPA: DUF1176 domain-containing protein [Rhodothermales bacterium]|nr:DUF1176 domain-containing protein [Rhodothermales bacterium]